jgi:hypothetical protein
VAVAKSGGTTSDTRYYVELSSLNLSGQFSTEWINLPKGEYVYLVDNTDHLGAVPPMNFADDVARFALKIDLIDFGGD